MIYVEVIYAPAGQPAIQKRVDYYAGLTVAAVIKQSGLIEICPEIVDCSVGIFSTLVKPDTLVKPGDRVELYRHLLIDPKEKRRQRAVSNAR
ncbi:MAG: RnfH family protein [Legionellaceae bacterium]|nr:RnfH family protein [Legionellaceae bacterium]